MNENKWKQWGSIAIFAIFIIVIYKLLDNFGNVLSWLDGFLTILAPFLIGTLIAYILYFPCKSIENAINKTQNKFIKSKSRTISIAITYLIVALIILIIVNFVLPALSQSIIDLANNLPTYYNNIIKYVENEPEDSVLNIIGVKNIITTSDGEKIGKMPRIKKYEKRLEKLNQKLARQKIGSKNFLKTKIMIQRVYEKIKNTRKYYTHKVTSKLRDEYDAIVCETLKVKEMIENNTKTLKKNIINSNFYEIIRQIIYKMKWKGKKCININTYYPSSQICSRCGSKNKDVKDLSVRVYECPNCGYELDRDINASINILWEGIPKIWGYNKINI